jgi:hypothetical protein
MATVGEPRLLASRPHYCNTFIDRCIFSPSAKYGGKIFGFERFIKCCTSEMKASASHG